MCHMQALLKQQQATVTHLQQLQSDMARHQSSNGPEAATACMQNLAAGLAIGATAGMVLGFGLAYLAALRR